MRDEAGAGGDGDAAAAEDAAVDADPAAAEATTDTTPGRVRLLALLLVGLLLPGLARWWLGTHGFDHVGAAVFAVGYGLTLGLVWRYWLSGISFVGPDG